MLRLRDSVGVLSLLVLVASCESDAAKKGLGDGGEASGDGDGGVRDTPVFNIPDALLGVDVSLPDVRFDIPSTCGNGKLDEGEECDDGNASNEDACLAICKLSPYCGDGVVFSLTEECDDGNKVNTDGCLNTCRKASCGDGVVDPAKEACDDSNQVNIDGCTNDCKAPQCGDGFVQNGVEACDDGNANNLDSCSNKCTKAVCGDGLLQTNEACDDGNTSNGDG